MKKELKDYLHLYLGCEILHIDDFFEERKTVLNGYFIDRWNRNCKLILRPLSDMTDEERIELFKKCSLFNLSDCKFELGDNWINAEFNGNVIDSIHFIGDNVEMMDNNGSFHCINPISPIIEFYLSKHFDLFNLIEAGLAIDKNTLK